jgi:hypothetical protein
LLGICRPVDEDVFVKCMVSRCCRCADCAQAVMQSVTVPPNEYTALCRA